MTCPAGVTRTITTARKVVFGIACAAAHCGHGAPPPQRGRTLQLHEHDLLQREHRHRADDQGFQATYRRHRPMVERSIAWLTRGNRRVPYRGVEKNNAWLHHRAAALNLRRLLALGLTIEDGTWQLA